MFNPGVSRYYFRLLALYVMALIMIIAAGRLFPSAPDTAGAVVLASAFAITAFISLLIFFNGYTSDHDKSVFMTLIAMSVKMLLVFVLALMYILVFKNDAIGSLILFFILYLAFTFFVVGTFISVLKRKSD